MINVQEMKERHIRSFIILLYAYSKLKLLLKKYYSNYGKVGLLQASTDFHRDSTNIWIENNI